MAKKPQLAFNSIQKQENPPKTAVFLHGILANRRNLMGFAKQFVACCPSWRAICVDLRHHGESQGFGGPDTLRNCANDIKHLLDGLQLEAHAVIGHSFGGRVALAYAQAYSQPDLQQLWILDALPGEVQGAESGVGVDRVIQALQAITLPVVSRQDLVTQLLKHGLSKSVALWMTTNLKETPEGLVCAFELKGIQTLLKDYWRESFWSVLEQDNGYTIHVVRGENSGLWTPTVLAGFAAIDESFRVSLHLLPGAGHWVHVDNSIGLIDLMAGFFK